MLCNEQGSYIKTFSEAVHYDATQQGQHTKLWRLGFQEMAEALLFSHTPAPTAGFLLLQGMFVPAPFPPTCAASVHELTLSTSAPAGAAGAHAPVALSSLPLGKGGHSAPCSERTGWGELVATCRSQGSGQP